MHTTSFRRRARLWAPIASLVFLAGCMMPRSEASLSATDRSPASVGKIGVSQDSNGNTVAEVNVQHFPPPAALAPELETYVVWARPAGQERFTNMGQMSVDADDRDGRAVVRLPYKSFELLVTAEASPTVSEPSDYSILRGNVGGAPAEQRRVKPRPAEAPVAEEPAS